MNFIRHIGRDLTGDFLSPVGYFFWGWLLVYLCTGLVISFREQQDRGQAFSPRQALAFCFPPRTFLCPSARLDYLTFLLNEHLIVPMVSLAMAVEGSRLAPSIAAHATRGLSGIVPFHFHLTNCPGVNWVFTIFLLAAADLGWTLQHFLFHRVPWLWELHKVHHSASELNLVTVARLHPLDALSQGWAAGICMGTLTIVAKALLGYEPTLILFLNVSAGMALFRVLGIYRHSHIWISYGPTLSRIFSSPAMHQIHHSKDKKHYDKNFGTVFSFWDIFLGTLYVPERRESLRYGLSDDDTEKERYDTWFGGLIAPLLPHPKAINPRPMLRGEIPVASK